MYGNVSSYEGTQEVSDHFSGAHCATWLSLQIVCGNKESEARKERNPTVSVDAGNMMKLDGVSSSQPCKDGTLNNQHCGGTVIGNRPCCLLSAKIELLNHIA